MTLVISVGGILRVGISSRQSGTSFRGGCKMLSVDLLSTRC